MTLSEKLAGAGHRAVSLHRDSVFFSRPLPKAGRELQTELNTIMKKKKKDDPRSEPRREQIILLTPTMPGRHNFLAK